MFKAKGSILHEPNYDCPNILYHMEYNIMKQKLFLEYIKKKRILYRDWGDSDHYKYVIEEANNPALSLCRVAKEDPLGKRWQLISQSYATNNIFGISGCNGHLIVDEKEGTKFLGFYSAKHLYESNEDNYDDHKHILSLPNNTYTLIVVQGHPEFAFNLVPSEYDTLFGDVYAKDDKDKAAFYEELRYFMRDYYEENLGYTNGKEYDFKECTDYEDGKVLKLIYCQKKNHYK